LVTVELERDFGNGWAKVHRDESVGTSRSEQINSGNVIRAAAINSPERLGKCVFDQHSCPKSMFMRKTVKSPQNILEGYS
jgi:hypothetical protein